MTALSKSAALRASAIGNSCVIPAKAGIQFTARAIAIQELGPGLRRGDEVCVIAAKAGIQ